jgi:hypothetical protein
MVGASDWGAAGYDTLLVAWDVERCSLVGSTLVFDKA